MMITFVKGIAIKFVSEGSCLIERLLLDGWLKEIPKEEVKNGGKSRKSGN